jgi:general secretion pathway protein E
VSCTEAAAPSDLARREMAADGCHLDVIHRGRGCAACRGTGYRGRTGIYELLAVDDVLRAEFLRRRGSGEMRRLAIDGGMRPLRADGWRQVALGMTTPEEVLRVAQG